MMKKRIVSIMMALIMIFTVVILPMNSVSSQAAGKVSSFEITMSAFREGNLIPVESSINVGGIYIDALIWEWNEGALKRIESFFPLEQYTEEFPNYAFERGNTYKVTFDVMADGYPGFDAGALKNSVGKVKLNGIDCTVLYADDEYVSCECTFTATPCPTTYEGYCGDTLDYYYYGGSHVLKIAGTGEMANYTPETVPWASYADEIKAVCFEEGPTTVGKNVFSGLSIKNVAFPSSMFYLDESAFEACTDLQYIFMRPSLFWIGESAFNGCSDLDRIFYYGADVSFTSIIVGNNNAPFTAAHKKYMGYPVISGPENEFTEPGDNVIFSIYTYDGFGNSDERLFDFQWQVSKDGGNTWTDCTGSKAKTNSYYFTADLKYDGRMYRCVVTNEVGSTTSEEVILRVRYNAPSVYVNSTKVTVAEGEEASMSVFAESQIPMEYQWQVSKDNGATWSNCTAGGYNTERYHFTAKMSMSGRKYRCVVSNASGSNVTEAITLKVTYPLPVINTQPENCTANVGAKATFSIDATAQGTVTYQWQVSKDGGNTWSNCTAAGYNTPTYSFTAKAEMNGRKYRCVVKNEGGKKTSKAATLTVSAMAAPQITAQPQNCTVTEGKKATFTVAASGEALTYQWQVSKDGGNTWSNCTATGYNTPTYSFTAKESMNGRKYRCIVKNAGGKATTKAALLMVNTLAAPQITAQPSKVSVAAGKKATFTVTATGTDLTYQWQVSKDGGSTWENCTATGYNTATYSFTAKASMNGRKYRCIVKNAAGKVTSSAAALTVR